MSWVNINSNSFYHQPHYSINTLFKFSPQDFIVHEITKHGQQKILHGKDMNFNPSDIPLIYHHKNMKNNDEDEDNMSTIGGGVTMNEIQLKIGEEMLSKLQEYEEYGQNVLQDYQNKQQYDPRDPLLIHLHDSHSIRRYIYEYIRNHYPLLVAKPGDSVDTYSISLDTSLLPLLSYHITRDDLTLLYHYLHKGPQHINASTGICIGCNLTRLDRTEVYRYLSSTYRNLESKTVDLRNQKYMKIFWKRKLIQKEENKRITGNKRKSVEESVECHADHSDIQTTPTTPTTSTKWSIWYTLVKVNLEQIDCCRRISELLGISINHVTQAGIKDRRGYTIQKGSLLLDTNDSKLFKTLQISKDFLKNNHSSMNKELNLHAMHVLSQVQEKLLSLNTETMKIFLQSGVFDRGGYELPNPLNNISSSSSSSSIMIDIGMAIGDIEFRNISISPGELLGNRFNILLRQVSLVSMDSSGSSEFSNHDHDNLLLDLIQQRLDLVTQQGFPNFFGSQRMGIISVNNVDSPYPIGPIIGKYLIMNNATSAVYSILSGIDGGSDVVIPTKLNSLLATSSTTTTTSISHNDDTEESILEENDEDPEDIMEDVQDSAATTTSTTSTTSTLPILQARALFLSGGSLTKVLQLLPQSSTREQKLIKNLLRNLPLLHTENQSNLHDLWEETCRNGIRGLPYATKQLWLSSYQSWLWNNVVNYYFGMNSSNYHTRLTTSINIGDVLLFNEHETLVRIATNDDLQLNLNHVVIPMIGKGWTQYPENHVGRYYHQILVNDGLLQAQMTCCGYCQDCHGCQESFLQNLSFHATTSVSTCSCSISCHINRGLKHLFESNNHNNNNNKSIFGLAKGCYRKVLTFPEDPMIEFDDNTSNHNKDQSNIRIQFTLGVGSYATVFLRELLANDKLL